MAPDDAELRRILTGAKTIAIVGLSDKRDRDSNEIARYLQSQGYRIIPVNPMVPEVLGEKSYPSLLEIPPEVHVDVVDIFRRSDQVGPIVDEALIRGVGAIWMQLGVENAAASAAAAARDVPVVENSCIMIQHLRLEVGAVSAHR
jgi:predicted CoA-binding protein